MKKKILASIMAIFLLASLLSLASCRSEETAIADTDVVFDEITSDRISQAEWEAILSGADAVENFRVKSETEDLGYHVCIISETNGDRTRTVERRRNKDGESEKWQNAFTRYRYKDGDCYYEINREGNGKWQKRQSGTAGQNGAVNSVYAQLLEAVDTYWSIHFADGEFELPWSEEHQGYICEYEDFCGIVKFKDGKMCAFADYVNGKEKAIETFIFYDFGQVEEIEIPAID